MIYFCPQCGHQLPEGMFFCPVCGMPVPFSAGMLPPPYPAPSPSTPGTGMATASLVLGICSILSFLLILTDLTLFYFLSIPLGIIGCIFGVMAKKEIRRQNPNGRTAMATSGIVCSIIGLCMGGIFLIFATAFLMWLLSMLIFVLFRG